MKILFLILLISGATITFYDVSALCIDPHCYAITITNELDTNYQGLQYVIEIPAFAESDTISPHQQFKNGTPINQIQCTDSKILMESTRNTPACVNESSVEKLENKGFILVDVVTITESKTTHADSIIPTSDNSINYDAELMSILEKDLVFTNKETNPNAFSELGSGNGIHWPIYKVTYPSTAQVGVPFDVIYDYSFVIPDEETGSYVNNNEQCSENSCGRMHLSAKVSSYVNATSDNLEHVRDHNGGETVPMTNSTVYYSYPEFDNTQPLEETFTFVINEPDIDYRIGEINVNMRFNNNDLVYFYVGADGNIIFDPMMKKETFENSSLAKSTAPSVMNTASVIRTELNKLQERTYDATQPSIPAPVGLRDGPPPELYGYFAERLLRENPDVNYEEFLQFHNFTQSWIDDFLNAMPHLKPDDSLTSQVIDFLTSYMLLPPAYGAEATTTIFGQLVNTDENGSSVFVHGGTVCAYDSDSFGLNPIIVNNEHACSETVQSGTFVFDVPTIDPNGSGNTDLVLKAFAKNSHFEFFLNNNEDEVTVTDSTIFLGTGS